MTALALSLALLIDRLFGWPEALVRFLGHPVIWIGRLISALEARINHSDHSPKRQRAAGVICVVATCLAATAPAILIAALLPDGALGLVITALVIAPFLASKSLIDHVKAVADPLVAKDLEGAREAVSRIVGRDPTTLDAPAIARAATESLAENTSDGIIAPLFWGLVFGLPGVVLYKAINTLDSMIGYRSERYENFGWAAARLDDLANLIPARATGLLYVLLGAQSKGAVRRHFALMWREAPLHRSPNAGWPEAAMAASLGIRLSGPRVYEGTPTQDPWLNGNAPDPEGKDMMQALRLCDRLVWSTMGALALIGVVGMV
ncbi:MAG: adenosylcobinamide-phosphate synthase CbiB [Pseudomonadota bacterium]